MAIGSFRGQLESAISRGLTDDPYAQRQASAQADYQAQADKARKDLSERLNRLGVLRGSGATASQYGEFEAGVLRGQQALGAQFEAQKQAANAQAIQQGIGLYGTTEQMGLAGRQQSEAERMGQFSRDLGTRQFLSQDALNRDRQREAERAALVQEGFQRAGVTGLYDGQRTVDQQRQDLSYRLGLSEMFGQDIAGVQGQTEARRAREQQEAFQQAGITGEFDGGRTLAAQQALGEIDGQDTLARDALEQEARQASMERGLRRTEGLAERNLRSSQASLDRRAASDMQAAQFDEAALEREARTTEAGLARDLAREELYGGYTSQYDREMGRVGTLAKTEGAAERRSREQMQQAQFGQESNEATRDREFQIQMRAAELEFQGAEAAEARALAREELYGGVTTERQRAMGRGTLGRIGQEAQIAAENRRLAEMETAGSSQRELANEAARMREAELMGYVEDASGRRQQTLGAREAQAQRGLEARRLTEIERAALVQEGFEGRRVGVAEAARRDQVAQERRRMNLAEQELYGGAEEISLDTLNIDPNLEMVIGRDDAIRQALQQQLGREPSQDELAAITGGRSIRGRETVASRESRLGREFTGDQAALDRELTRGEAALDRGLTEDQARLQRSLAREEMYGGEMGLRTGQTLAAREGRAGRILARDLSEAEIESREGQNELQRGLAREELYGQDVSSMSPLQIRALGGTLASREARETRDFARSEAELDRGLTREGRAEDVRLQEISLYGRELSDSERSMVASGRGGPSTIAAQDLTQRGDQFDRELTNQTSQANLQRQLMREELYGSSDPRMQMGPTLAARESREARELAREEIASREEQSRLGRVLAREELYGGARGLASGQTLASRDQMLRAELGRGGLQVDRDRLNLAEEELYGGVGMRGMSGQPVGTLAAREARISRADQRDLIRREEERYETERNTEATRYEATRQDIENERAIRDEDRLFQRRMDVLGARRSAEAMGGTFNLTEEDILNEYLLGRPVVRQDELLDRIRSGQIEDFARRNELAAELAENERRGRIEDLRNERDFISNDPMLDY